MIRRSVSKQKKMRALILTGGMGTRLRPLTLYTPKPLLPVANTPFLGYPLSLLRKHGVHEVILCTADSEKPYKKFIGNQKRLGTSVICSREFKELGTAGALKNAQKNVGSSVFVFNGDVLTDLNLTAMLKFHHLKKACATIAVMRVSDPSSYGLVMFEPSGKIKNFVEKPSAGEVKKNVYYINAGIYIFEKTIFDKIPYDQRYSVERQLFPDCLKKNIPLYAFVMNSSTYWLDMGTPEKYLQANISMIKKNWLNNVESSIGKKSVIDKTADIEEENVIGSGCKIGEHAILKKCVLLDRVTIENNAILENCIVGSDSKIGHHTIVKNAKIIGNYSIITPFSRL